MYKIGQHLIPPEIAELIPESVARENGVVPLRLVDGRLHILIPEQKEIDANNLLEKLTFILNKDIELTFGEPDTVFEMVDSLYSMAQARVTRCNLNFALTCSRHWLELAETDSPGERHCPDCRETVFLCESEEDAEDHARLGHCVALHVRCETEVVETMGLIEFVENEPGSPEALKEGNRFG